MNMDIEITDECLNCKAIADLIDNFQCEFVYYPEMHIGYILFDNKTDLYEFTERADEIMTSIETLNSLYEMED